jgi:hypothetical protein
MNAAFDSSRCTAYLKLDVSSGNDVYGGPYNIQTNGRRGPLTKYIITAPPSSGSAVAIVDVYTCDGRKHHTVTSKRQYYP